MNIQRGIFVLAALALMGCAGDDLDGPERFEFDHVGRASLAVQSGQVRVFGSGQVEGGAILDRWWSGDGDFQRLEERNNGEELLIDSICDGSLGCEVRYELAVDESTTLDVQLDSGSLDVYRITSNIDARIGDGSMEGSDLSASVVDIEIDQGTADLRFVEAPDHLRLRIGDQATASVLLPDRRYLCNFDQEAVSIGDLECHGNVPDRIEVEPADADVMFAVE